MFRDHDRNVENGLFESDSSPGGKPQRLTIITRDGNLQILWGFLLQPF
jgi:hypothetical protein